MSCGEFQVADYIRSIYRGDVILRHMREIGMELDVWLPTIRLGIEFDEERSHAQYEEKRPGYHDMKRNLCRKANISLLNIKQFEWTNKRDEAEQKIFEAIETAKKERKREPNRFFSSWMKRRMPYRELRMVALWELERCFSPKEFVLTDELRESFSIMNETRGEKSLIKLASDVRLTLREHVADRILVEYNGLAPFRGAKWHSVWPKRSTTNIQSLIGNAIMCVKDFKMTFYRSSIQVEADGLSFELRPDQYAVNRTTNEKRTFNQIIVTP